MGARVAPSLWGHADVGSMLQIRPKKRLSSGMFDRMSSFPLHHRRVHRSNGSSDRNSFDSASSQRLYQLCTPEVPYRFFWQPFSQSENQQTVRQSTSPSVVFPQRPTSSRAAESPATSAACHSHTVTESLPVCLATSISRGFGSGKPKAAGGSGNDASKRGTISRELTGSQVSSRTAGVGKAVQPRTATVEATEIAGNRGHDAGKKGTVSRDATSSRTAGVGASVKHGTAAAAAAAEISISDSREEGAGVATSVRCRAATAATRHAVNSRTVGVGASVKYGSATAATSHVIDSREEGTSVARSVKRRPKAGQTSGKRGAAARNATAKVGTEATEKVGIGQILEKIEGACRLMPKRGRPSSELVQQGSGTRHGMPIRWSAAVESSGAFVEVPFHCWSLLFQKQDEMLLRLPNMTSACIACPAPYQPVITSMKIKQEVAAHWCIRLLPHTLDNCPVPSATTKTPPGRNTNDLRK